MDPFSLSRPKPLTQDDKLAELGLPAAQLAALEKRVNLTVRTAADHEQRIKRLEQTVGEDHYYDLYTAAKSVLEHHTIRESYTQDELESRCNLVEAVQAVESATGWGQ